jgi:hypothetical protein
MENILNVILTNTYTLAQIKKRIRILKDYLISQLFRGIRPSLNEKDLAYLRSLEPSFYQQFNKDNLYPIFADLEKRISQFIPLYLYLPFETDDQVTSQIGQFIQKTYGKLILFDVKYDPALIAGCSISWQGIYRDYSLRKKIEDRKQEILSIVKGFLK